MGIKNTKVTIKAQYLKDLSFELPDAPNVFLKKEKQDIGVSFDLDASQIEENLFELEMLLGVESLFEDKSVGFVIEVKYCGLFEIEAQDELKRKEALLSRCPDLLFPYIRRIVSDLTSSANMEPLMLQSVDFLEIYKKKASTEGGDNDVASKAIN